MESNFLEKKAFRKKVSEKEILKTFVNKLDSNEVYIQDIMSGNKQSIEEYKVALSLVVSSTLAVGRDIRKYIYDRYMEIESLEEEIGALKEKLSEKNSTEKEMLNSLAGRMEEFMSLVEENVKAVAVSKKIKTVSKQGKQKDTRIPDEEVIELYNSGKTPTEIANYYNTKYGGTIVTMAGIRGRLKNLGVYKQKWTQR